MPDRWQAVILVVPRGALVKRRTGLGPPIFNHPVPHEVVSHRSPLRAPKRRIWGVGEVVRQNKEKENLPLEKIGAYTPVVFYHARVKLKPERAKESPTFGYEYDLTRGDLLAKIAIPFIQGKQFFCGGTVVLTQRVEEIRFNQTEQSADELLPFLRARARASNYVMVPTLRDVTHEGKDVTREILDEAKANGSDAPVSKAEPVSDRVFIVHGHDNRAVDQIELLIRRFGLTPIILREEPSAGRTVIEKFEAHANVGFAVVLLTPDDMDGLTPDRLAPRARQNVIWEWGYLIARLGRARVICLYKQGVEMPSDLHGLVTIHIGDDARTSAEEIRKELVQAGYRIP